MNKQTPEYTAWCHMKARCQNENHPSFKDYGGRGISVCEQWNNFNTFLKDMGKRPTAKHSLERKNNSKGYEPDNCIWGTKKEQANNTRTNHIVKAKDETLTLAQAAERAGITYQAMQKRIKKGRPLFAKANPRTPIMLTAGGKTMPILHWANLFKMPNSSLRLKLRSGKTLEQIKPEFFK